MLGIVCGVENESARKLVERTDYQHRGTRDPLLVALVARPSERQVGRTGHPDRCGGLFDRHDAGGLGGDTWYPQLSCGGRLARIGASGDYVVYTETITTGRYDPSIGKGCLDGVISVGLAGPDLGWGWFGTFRGQVVTAYARLTRQ